jgi:uncharacterized membrane protein YraQ (UPF0718 family)
MTARWIASLCSQRRFRSKIVLDSWNGGISFGGVIAFIFADLIVLPILNIYRKYYGRSVCFHLNG